MPEQQYRWMLGLAAAWLQSAQCKKDDDPPGQRVERVIGVAGQLKSAPTRAANDLAAALLVLVFIWAWNCAKYRAILGAFALKRAKHREINAAPIFTARPAETTLSQRLSAYPTLSRSIPGLCQISCLLTVSPTGEP